MSTVRVFVGLDYHDSGVQVCILDPGGRQLANAACLNDASVLAAFVAPHGGQVFAAIEACTGSADLADELVGRFGWSVDLAHPGYVRRMKQTPDKTDFTDARVLADLERVGYLPKVWTAPAAVRDLREVVRYRHQLAAQRRATKVRVRALLRQHRRKPPAEVRPWTIAWHKWLRDGTNLPDAARWVIDRHLADLADLAKRLKTVETHLARLTADDPLVQYLLAVKGVGPITAVTIRAEIGRFDRFRTGKQVARFCGLSPRNASSGTREADSGLIRAGNPLLRTMVIEAAHRVARYQPRWRALKAALISRGKPPSVAVAAVANRWMRWLFHHVQPAALAA
jgi:transposase